MIFIMHVVVGKTNEIRYISLNDGSSVNSSCLPSKYLRLLHNIIFSLLSCYLVFVAFVPWWCNTGILEESIAYYTNEQIISSSNIMISDYLTPITQYNHKLLCYAQDLITTSAVFLTNKANLSTFCYLINRKYYQQIFIIIHLF